MAAWSEGKREERERVSFLVSFSFRPKSNENKRPVRQVVPRVKKDGEEEDRGQAKKPSPKLKKRQGRFKGTRHQQPRPRRPVRSSVEKREKMENPQKKKTHQASFPSSSNPATLPSSPTPYSWGSRDLEVLLPPLPKRSPFDPKPSRLRSHCSTSSTPPTHSSPRPPVPSAAVSKLRRRRPRR